MSTDLPVDTNEMTNIVKPDQHLATYVYAKQVKPDARFVVRAFKKSDVEAVDTIVELAHGERDVVKSQSDWQVIEEIITFFSKRFPGEWQEFVTSVKDIKNLKNYGGNAGYGETGEVQHIGSIPPRLMRMIKSIFPYQEWNKSFTSKFVNKFKLFKVGEKQK